MKLLFPQFLWALFALLIPIIIHLFNFRKFTRVYFSNIDLLKEVKLETKSKSRLKHWIVLLLRMLAIGALVLAFCQPYLPTTDAEISGDNVVSIFVDNSHSMDSKGTNGYRLELAKEQASEIVNTYGPTDKFQIITNNFEGRHQRLYGKSEVLALIEEIEPTFTTQNLSDIYLRQSGILDQPNVNKTAYWLSDFQTNATDFENTATDSSISLFCIPYEHSKMTNVYIDSIWFNTPVRSNGTEDMVMVRVVNASDNEIEFKINLSINNEKQSFVNFQADAGTSVNCEVPFTIRGNGIQHGQLSLSDYPDADLTFDDDFYFSYSVQPKINVLHIYEGTVRNDSSGFLGTLYGRNSIFKFKNSTTGNVDFSSLKGYDFIALSNIANIGSGLSSELTNYVEQGGSIIVFPAANSNLSSYNNFVQSITDISLQPASSAAVKVNTINVEHPIYQNIFNIIPSNVDLPKLTLHYPIDYSISSGTERLMTLQDGKPFITYTQLPQGSISICAVPLNAEASNFPKHALFVPTLLRLAEFSNRTGKYSYVIGKDDAVKSSNVYANQEELSIQEAGEEFNFIPELSKSNSGNYLLLYDQIKRAGHYDVLYNGDRREGISFNFDRSESEQNFLDATALKKELNNYSIGGLTTIISGADSTEPLALNEITKGKKYWWHLILLGIILLALETIVIRVWR